MLDRSPITTADAFGAAAHASSARFLLRACRTTSCPSASSPFAARRPRPADDPVIRIALIALAGHEFERHYSRLSSQHAAQDAAACSSLLTCSPHVVLLPLSSASSIAMWLMKRFGAAPCPSAALKRAADAVGASDELLSRDDARR